MFKAPKRWGLAGFLKQYQYNKAFDVLVDKDHIRA